MRRLWLRARRLIGAVLPTKLLDVQEQCWCGTHHLGDYWHDPTHGKVDRDIQDAVNKNFAQGTSRHERFIIMLNAQGRRDRGLSI